MLPRFLKQLKNLSTLCFPILTLLDFQLFTSQSQDYCFSSRHHYHHYNHKYSKVKGSINGKLVVPSLRGYEKECLGKEKKDAMIGLDDSSLEAGHITAQTKLEFCWEKEKNDSLVGIFASVCPSFAFSPSTIVFFKGEITFLFPRGHSTVLKI